MGIYDRDWMRRRDDDPPSANGPVLKPRPPSSRKIVIRIVILAALVIMGLCFSPILRQIEAANNIDRDEPQSIPSTKDEMDAEPGGKPPPGLLRPVDVNTATLEELMSIPGMADNVARAIIGKRPFNRLEDLTQVPGIKDKKLILLRPYITIADEP